MYNPLLIESYQLDKLMPHLIRFYEVLHVSLLTLLGGDGGQYYCSFVQLKVTLGSVSGRLSLSSYGSIAYLATADIILPLICSILVLADTGLS